MKKINDLKKYCYILVAVLIGALFFYITYKTPLAGDDWGYALNGMSGNPFATAISFYQSWSGRFFSELWGFIAAPNRWLWNIVNPLLFVTIFMCIYRLAKVKKYHILTPIMILAIILSVDDNLRMETYTWLMGTTYIIPLAMALIYFVLMDHLFFGVYGTDNKDKTLFLLSNFLLFYIGLTMENIAAMMLVGIVLMMIYAHFNRQELVRYLAINLVVSLLAFMIMRSSPGSQARLLRDNAEWAKLSVFEKVANGYPSFLEFTFINNNYLILFLSMSLLLLTCYSKEKLNQWLKVGSVVIQVIAVFVVFSFVLPIEVNPMLDPKSLFSMLFWPIYTIDGLALLFFGLSGRRQAKALFMYMMAGGSNMVMLYSPVFGSRSSIYTVIFMIAVIVIVIDGLDINKYILLLVFLIGLGVSVDRINEYLYKYNLVGLVTNERNAQMDYYRDHPEVEEAWIRRYPIYTIHSADVEPGDDYHFETFKDYYHLPQAADKIFFYFEETE